jgi:thiol-disulfide isomerase/thioredoxin
MNLSAYVQRRAVAGIVTIAVLTALVVGCSSNKSETSAPKQTATAAQAAPQGKNQFQAYDPGGKLRSSNEWIGKQPVVINFWGTWCPPCRREIPDLIKLYAEYAPKGVQIIGLAVKDEPVNVKVFSEQAGMQWVMLMADYDILSQFGITGGVPTTIFLDRNGNEVSRVIGSQSYEQFKPRFDSIL